MNDAPVHLACGALELTLVPNLGGAIARFDCIEGGVRKPLMRPAMVPGHALDCASFPLVPYSNRIRGGRFDFRGRTIVLAPNMAGDASPLHGQGWLAPWPIWAASGTAAELVFVHQAGEWPWRYEARQVFALDANGLDLTLTCRNLSDDAMPCALGLHPYFPCDAATVLDTRVTGAWTIDADVLPVDLVPATGRYDLANRSICAQDLDNGFEGWTGEAAIRNPGGPTLRIRSADAGRFQVYSPAAGGLFVAEPVQSANAALNEPEGERARLGVTVLAPGETARLHTRFEVEPA